MSIQVKQQTSLLDNVIHPIPYVLIGCKVFFINTTTVAYDVHQCVTMCRHSLLFNLYSSYHYWCALRSCVGLSVLCGVSYALAQRRTLGFLSSWNNNAQTTTPYLTPWLMYMHNSNPTNCMC